MAAHSYSQLCISAHARVSIGRYPSGENPRDEERMPAGDDAEIAATTFRQQRSSCRPCRYSLRSEIERRRANVPGFLGAPPPGGRPRLGPHWLAGGALARSSKRVNSPGALIKRKVTQISTTQNAVLVAPHCA